MTFRLSSLLNRAQNPLFSCTLKHSLTAVKECSSSKQTLHAGSASWGLSQVCSIVAITRYCMARMRSHKSSASLAKASLAFSRAYSNLFFAISSVFLTESSRRSVSSMKFIRLVRVLISLASSPPAAWSVLTSSNSTIVLDLPNTSYKYWIPSANELKLDNKSFLASPSNLDLTSSISRKIKRRNFWSTTSPSFSFSAAAALPFRKSKPIVALNTVVTIADIIISHLR